MGLGTEFEAKFGDSWSAKDDSCTLFESSELSDIVSMRAIGNKRSFVPPLGAIAWELPKVLADALPFLARIYRIPSGHLVGYVRVPNYTRDEVAAKSFRALLAQFEDVTSALVLDEVNNPGGSMFYMYELLSALSDRPLKLGTHVLNLNDDDEAIARDIVTLFDGGNEVPPEDRPSPELVSYSKFVLEEIESGRKHETRPTYLGGIKEIVPASHPFSKPIILLTNKNTYSAAEFLAAILQDNRRVTVFGEKTAGLGGCARRINIQLKRLDMSMTGMTWTRGLRLNGEPFQNIGIVPDIVCPITVEDLQTGFLGYGQALLSVIGALLTRSTNT